MKIVFYKNASQKLKIKYCGRNDQHDYFRVSEHN